MTSLISVPKDMSELILNPVQHNGVRTSAAQWVRVAKSESFSPVAVKS
jgi:hypothetical protein